MSILSAREDGFGFFYGYKADDNRQINVRFEPAGRMESEQPWAIYVGGSKIGWAPNKREAEALALDWMRDHPQREGE